MDLNYLYYRQQVSTFMADNAICGSSQRAHRDLADRYERRIAAAKTPALRLAGGAVK